LADGTLVNGIGGYPASFFFAVKQSDSGGLARSKYDAMVFTGHTGPRHKIRFTDSSGDYSRSSTRATIAGVEAHIEGVKYRPADRLNLLQLLG
jgi:hypothetical protein